MYMYNIMCIMGKHIPLGAGMVSLASFLNFHVHAVL